MSYGAPHHFGVHEKSPQIDVIDLINRQFLWYYTGFDIYYLK